MNKPKLLVLQVPESSCVRFVRKVRDFFRSPRSPVNVWLNLAARVIRGKGNSNFFPILNAVM